LEEQRSQRQQTQRRSRLLKWGLLAFVAVALAVVTALVVSWDELRQAPTAAQPKFVWVSSGEFDMGSPTSERGRFDNETLHKVTLTRPFFLQTTEVTQGQWAVVMGNSPSAFPECGPECPQENVSWWEALEYLNRRSVSEGFEKCYELTGCLGIPGSNFRCQSVAFKGLTCDGYRLPTEAEWEYAARASTDTMLPQGDLTQDQCSPKDPKLDPAGWYCGNAERKTHPIGQKTPNTWGLYDMAGNVTEWVWDWHFGDYGAAAATDPLGPDYGPGRAYRGCNWSSPPKDCRAANRGYSEPESRHSHLGFRAARTAY
jgi:formylglycine-generating enzyme required for sulfatase activity